MLRYLKEHPTAFDSDDVLILGAAFNKAWESVQSSGAKFASDEQIERARAILAKHIIMAAMGGERDQRQLVDGALVSLCTDRSEDSAQH